MGISASSSAVRTIAWRWRWVSLIGLSIAIIYWVVGQGVVALSCLPGWDDRAMANTFAEHLVSARTFGVVLDEVNRHALFWFTIGFLVICFALWRWTNAALAKRMRMKVFIGVAALAAGTVSVAGAIALCGTDYPNSYGYPASVSQVQTIRSQLELYQVQHNGDYPTLAQMWTNLVTETEVDGSPGDGSGNEFGPYLQQPPVNRHTQGFDVAADNTGSWKYDEKTGDVQVVCSPRVFIENSLDPNWFVPAPEETLSPLEATVITARIAVVRSFNEVGRDLAITLGVIIACSLGWFLLLRRWTRGRDPLFAAAAIPMVLGCVALAGFLFARGVDHREIAAIARCHFAAALLWAWSTVVTLQFRWDALRLRQDGTVCEQCDYDLTGTRLAGRCACPECGAKIVSIEARMPVEVDRLRAA